MPSGFEPSFEGRDVVVTGGAGALGQAVVDAFGRAGAIVHVPVRGKLPAASDPRARYTAGVDLTDESAVAGFYAGLPGEPWGSVHLAGGFAMAGIAETTLGDLRAQLDINLVSAFLCCREAVRRFRSRPGGGGGRIVNVASRAAVRPEGGKAAYTLAKAAVVALTLELAEELKTEAILVNAVAPGTIDTPANRSAMAGLDPSHFVSPAEIADVIVWLASPANRIASGTVVPVYGRS